MPAGRKPAGWAGRGLRKEVQLEGRSSAVGGGSTAKAWPNPASWAAGAMEPQLGLHELLHVFSFLEARDLLCAAQVDKVVSPVPGGRQGWAHGLWRVRGWSVPSRPQFPKSGRERAAVLNPPGISRGRSWPPG